jgi:uncharacterized protein (DUF2267 family)
MTTAVFLRTVQAKVGQIDREQARRATAAVFHALRDRLTPVEAEQLAAQLPKPLQILWRAGEQPRRKPARVRREAFYHRVATDAGVATRRDAREITLGVFAALKEAISEGEADDVLAQLPKDLKTVWAEAR